MERRRELCGLRTPRQQPESFWLRQTSPVQESKVETAALCGWRDVVVPVEVCLYLYIYMGKCSEYAAAIAVISWTGPSTWLVRSPLTAGHLFISIDWRSSRCTHEYSRPQPPSQRIRSNVHSDALTGLFPLTDRDSSYVALTQPERWWTLSGDRPRKAHLARFKAATQRRCLHPPG